MLGKEFSRLTVVMFLVLLIPMINIGLSSDTEIQVNSYTTGNQISPAGAMDSSGNFVITWVSPKYNLNCANYSKIYSQRFDSSGNKVGDEFLVNPTNMGFESSPTIAMDASGNFIIAFVVSQKELNCTNYSKIYALRYDSSGNKIGNAIQVNSTAYGDQLDPSAAMDSKGNFIIAWQSKGYWSFCSNINAQRFDNDGNKVGKQFQVNNNTLYENGYPCAAIDSNGNFVIAWASSLYDLNCKNKYLINAQRFDNNGKEVGKQFQVNSYTTKEQNHPSIAMNAGGTFMITWQSEDQDGKDFGIYAQLYVSDGSNIGTNCKVNSQSDKDQNYPYAAMDSEGNYIITWQSNGKARQSNCHDETGFDVYAQKFDSFGKPIDEEFNVNTYTKNDQLYPRIMMNNTKNFVIAWQSSGQDGNGYGIFARVYNGIPVPPTQTITFTPTETPTYTPIVTSTITETETIVETPNPTVTVTSTPVETETFIETVTPIETATETYYPTPTETENPTPTATFSDAKPVLYLGTVTPDKGNEKTTFVYQVFYVDEDGGLPRTSTVNINGVFKSMSLKPGFQLEGMYNCSITGSELENGNNQFYFYFVDDEGNTVRSPKDESYKGPYVTKNIDTPIPTETMTEIPTPVITPTETDTTIETPIVTETPIETPIETPTPIEKREAIFGMGLNAQYIGEWEDTFVDESTPDRNNGKDENLYLANGLKNKKYTHIRVNIDPLPDDVQILEAQLYFYVTDYADIGPFDIATYGLSGAPGLNWIETKDTFKMYNSDQIDANWTGNAGGYQDKSSEMLANNRWEQGGGWKYMAFTSDGLAYLQNRTRDGLCNFIVSILPDSSESEVFEQKFASSENPDLTLPPYLRIVYAAASTPTTNLAIASPNYFFYNTILLSWTPIANAANYQFDCMVDGKIYSSKVSGNWMRLIADNRAEWDFYTSLGSIPYRVTALDSKGNIISGPTDIVYFTCYDVVNPDLFGAKMQVPKIPQFTTGNIRVANPPDFYNNTILLSWSAIYKANNYMLEIKYSGNSFSMNVNDNWLRLIAKDTTQWKAMTTIGNMQYRVTAIDSDGNVIKGPTDWFGFKCY
jgi:hypothetical protein